MRELTDESFEREVLEADRPVVVDFWAPWCGPCEAVTAVFEQLAADHGDRILFTKLDIDAHPLSAARYGVLSIPTAILFEGGEPRETVVGARPRDGYERAWAPWLGASAPGAK